MRKTVLIVINALLILPLLIFFRKGANIAINMLSVWFVVSIINSVFSKNIKQLLLYNGCLALFATIGIFACCQLYFKYVCWDSVGEAIMIIEMIAEIIYIAVLTGIESLVKYIIAKMKRS